MPSLWQEISEDAFDRQRGRCARCRKRLAWPNHVKGTFGAWQAHHVNGKPWDDRLRNCVCLCMNWPQECHEFAHDYDSKYGKLWTRFPYRYG